MKRYIIALLALAFLTLTLTAQPAASQKRKAKAPYVENQILVKLKAGAQPSIGPKSVPDREQVALQIMPEQSLAAEALDVGAPEGLYQIALNGSISVEEAVLLAQSDPRVEYAEPNYLLYPAETRPNDADFRFMWGLFNDSSESAGADIGALKAWDITQGSDNVMVAVIDTGVDFSHPDLAANAWVNPREIAGNGFDDDGNGFIDDVNGWDFLFDDNKLIEDGFADRHGTHVGGIVGAVGNNAIGITGVAWRVKLMSLKILGSKAGDTAGAIKAIKYAIDQRKRGVNVRAINASWGPACGEDGDSRSLKKAIMDAGDEGILFVNAAGNGGCDGRGDDNDDLPVFPSSWSSELDSLISVAALDKSDKLYFGSNFGHESVSVGAPGVSIYSTSVRGAYEILTGTSMATPHVTGVAALLWSHEPALTPAQVKDRIIKTAMPISSLASKVVSSGRVNAFNALTNTVPSPVALAIGEVQTDKKWVIVNGLGFLKNEIVVEVNGVAISGKTKYYSSYSLANETLTRFKVKLGKSGIESTFPNFTQVNVTLFNQSTGERSAPFAFTRRVIN